MKNIQFMHKYDIHTKKDKNKTRLRVKCDNKDACTHRYYKKNHDQSKKCAWNIQGRVSQHTLKLAKKRWKFVWLILPKIVPGSHNLGKFL